MRGLCSYSSVFQTLQACLRCHFLYTRLDASWKLGWPSYITSVLLLICFYRLENGSWIAPHILDQNSLPAWLFSWSVTSGTMSSVWGGVNTYSYARFFINLFPHIISDTSGASWALSALLDFLGCLKWICLVSLCLAFLERSLEVL